jgi:hypothetical protein
MHSAGQKSPTVTTSPAGTSQVCGISRSTPGDPDMHCPARIAPAYDGHCDAFIDRQLTPANNQSTFFD